MKNVPQHENQDLVCTAVPDGTSLALCIHRVGDWAVTTGGIPQVDYFDMGGRVLDRSSMFGVTHVPSGRLAHRGPCVISAMYLVAAFAEAFGDENPMDVAPSINAERAKSARATARSRMECAATLMHAENERATAKLGASAGPACNVNEPWREAN